MKTCRTQSDKSIAQLQAVGEHSGKPSTTKAGVNLVNDGWYLTVKYYERTPPLAIDTFVLDESSDMIIDAEGVIFTGPYRITKAWRGEPRVQWQGHEEI